MRELKLSASLGNYSQFAARKASKRFRAIAKKVFVRDNYACQYCGFQAQEYQEVVNLDQNYQHNTLSNMGTACVFCTQCNFLESLGDGSYGGGTLVYLPEISQVEVNSLCHVLFCAMINNTSYKETAQSIYRTLRMRSQVIEDKLGEGMSNPAIFGQLLVDHHETKGRGGTDKLLSDLRLLPARGRFQKQIEKWATSALSQMD